MIKCSLYLTEEQDVKLRQVAHGTSTVSEHIRRAIDNYLIMVLDNRVSTSPKSTKEEKDE